MTAIELAAVERTYGDRRALGPIDLVVPPGEKVVLVGPSGSGKSTLLKVVAATVAPSAGRVTVGGTDLESASSRHLRAHRRGLGLVPQATAMTPQLSVHRNVLVGALTGWPWHRVLASLLWPMEVDRVHTALERVGLADRQWDRCGDLSGGEAQRVAVARGLLNAPRIVLADEPTASLDPVNAQRVTDLLIEDADERSATLVFSTHWVSLIADRFDRVVGLREGVIVLDTNADELSDDMLDELYAGSDERR